jgi:hypothetical protein
MRIVRPAFAGLIAATSSARRTDGDLIARVLARAEETAIEMIAAAAQLNDLERWLKSTGVPPRSTFASRIRRQLESPPRMQGSARHGVRV